MKKLVVRKFLALTALLLTFSLIGIPSASAEVSVEEKSLALLSSVFNLDLSKYQIIHNGTSNGYTSAFGPNAKQVVVDYTLISGESRKLANIVFVNSDLWFCNLDTLNGKQALSNSSASGVTESAKNAISAYQNYASQYSSKQVSHISLMSNMLNTAYESKLTSLIEGNIKLNITSKSDLYNNITRQTISWFYSENNFDVPRKSITFEYTNGLLNSISDTWNLFSIGSYKYISKEEALDLAWVAAQNCTLKFVAENGTAFTIKPDLANSTIDTNFSLQPRSPMVLYPFWQIRYYFSKSYYSDYGIQVGIWGDTKQIAYCESLTHLGGPSPTTTTQTRENLTGNTISLPIISLLVVTIAGSIVTCLLIKRKRNK